MSFYDTIMTNVNYSTTQSSQKMFNSHKWDIKFQLLNIKNDMNISLITQNLNSIIITNDIEIMCPSIQFVYFDLGQSITKIIDNNNLLLKIYMKQPPPNSEDPYWKEQKLLTLQALFYIFKIEIVKKMQSGIIYRFTAVHYNQTFLRKNINYATQKGNEDSIGIPQSPLKIIEKILTKIGYPHSTFYNDTEQRIHFISSQSMSIKDDIQYLLKLTPSKHDPPSYFMHSLRLNQAMLINSKILENRLINPCNDFVLVGNNPKQDMVIDLANQVTDLKMQNFEAGLDSERYLGNIDFHDYDHNKREWNITSYNYDIVNNLMNNQIIKSNNEYETVFINKKDIQRNDLWFNFPNFNQNHMYNFLRNLQLGTNQIRFRVLGNISRDCGQYVNITVSDKTQIQFQGLWNIYECRHILKGKMYFNELLCYRTFTKRAIFEKQNGLVY